MAKCKGRLILKGRARGVVKKHGYIVKLTAEYKKNDFCYIHMLSYCLTFTRRFFILFYQLSNIADELVILSILNKSVNHLISF